MKLKLHTWESDTFLRDEWVQSLPNHQQHKEQPREPHFNFLLNDRWYYGFEPEMKTHSDENFQVLECRSVRKQRKYGNNAPVHCCVSSVWVPSDRSAESDPSPGVTAAGLGPRDEHSKEAGRFLRTGWPFGWPLLWFLSSALKAGRRD